MAKLGIGGEDHIVCQLLFNLKPSIQWILLAIRIHLICCQRLRALVVCMVLITRKYIPRGRLQHLWLEQSRDQGGARRAMEETGED